MVKAAEGAGSDTVEGCVRPGCGQGQHKYHLLWPGQSLESLMDLMRRKGAVRVKVDGIEVELGPPPAVLPGTTPATPWPTAEEESSMCPCGHPLAEHSEAGCLNGCSDERCLPAEEGKAS